MCWPQRNAQDEWRCTTINNTTTTTTTNTQHRESKRSTFLRQPKKETRRRERSERHRTLKLQLELEGAMGEELYTFLRTQGFLN